jgi:hypothetical protein
MNYGTAKRTAAIPMIVAAATVIVYSIGRAVYYPFWAANAPRDQLSDSWGGPSAIGATVVHCLIALALTGAAYAVMRVGLRWRRRGRS